MNWFKKIWKARSESAPRGAASVEPRHITHDTDAMNNFTPRAQQVLALARKEADRLNHNFVGTEHLLLGLIKLGYGVAVNVLQKLGLDLETVRMEVEKQVGSGPDQKLMGNIPYTPRVKKVLALASKEAKALNHTYVGTEHILLGLLREGDGVAARVLQNLGVDVEGTRREILRELDPNFELDKGDTQPTPGTGPVSIPPGTGTAQTPNAAKPQTEGIDLRERYDVYCSERSQEVVVYRHALFKGVRRLFREDRDTLADFFELEQADGQQVFVAKYSVVKFCKAGGTPTADQVPGKEP